jgi:hypothetical protein
VCRGSGKVACQGVSDSLSCWAVFRRERGLVRRSIGVVIDFGKLDSMVWDGRLGLSYIRGGSIYCVTMMAIGEKRSQELSGELGANKARIFLREGFALSQT